MARIKLPELLALQEDASHVRNICILAHVDHGKTSLTDSLIASNGIISARQAGKLRYMDSRDDEQDRGITMKSSAIALVFEGRELVNIVDSPGHVDFGPEVSTAIRLSDGAIVVVDAVEGVCIQTHTVLQQVWREGLAPILFINKLDRLVFELQLSPEEAHAHLERIVRQVNAILGSLNSVAHYSAAAGAAGGGAADAAADAAAAADDFEFRPEEGSVVFGSALHGWAFTAGTFAELMAPKLPGVTAAELRPKLWGEWYWAAKAGAFTTDSSGGRLRPLFAQLALANVWKAHEAAADDSAAAPAQLSKVVKALGLDGRVSAHELGSSDASVRLRALLSAWLPLAPALLGAVLAHVPPARVAQARRLDRIWPPRAPPLEGGGGGAEDDEEGEAAVRAAARACDAHADAVLAHVSKMFVNSHGEQALGFARVYGGTLRRGARLYVSGPGAAALAAARAEARGGGGGEACAPASDDEPSRLDAGELTLYLMMGRDLTEVESVPAGCLCALGGLGARLLKSGALATARGLPPFRPLWDATGSGAPIVRVAVEPLRPTEMGALQAGLRRLNQADPSVQVSHLPTGELVLGACGEVHLERCLKDLRDDFARVELRVSPPLIPFRESVADGGVGVALATTADRRWRVRVSARPLPARAVLELSRRARLVATAEVDGAEAAAEAADAILAAEDGALSPAAAAALARLARGDAAARGATDDDIAAAAELGASAGCAAVALGPTSHPTCVLFASAPLLAALAAGGGGGGGGDDEPRAGAAGAGAGAGAGAAFAQLAHAAVAGFQLAAAAGPLCEEPMANLAFSLEAIEPTDAADGVDAGAAAAASAAGGGDPAATVADGGGGEAAAWTQYGPLGVQLMAASREACRQALLAASPRLVEAVYACALQCAQEAMGRMYGVLSRRRARVTREELIEGTALFVVHAFLPVVESLGFAAEIRKTTSGAAHPQLVFSHWQRLAADPLEDLAASTIDDDAFERDSSKNLARAYVRAVRKRKGLLLEEKLVGDGTKQRTLARKK